MSTADELVAAARAARNVRETAHAISIVDARTPLAEQARDVEEIAEAFAKMVERFARQVRSRDKAALVEACVHDVLMDDRLVVLASDPPEPTAGTCAACGSLVCWPCRHRVGQHGEMGCRVEGCDCPWSHK